MKTNLTPVLASVVALTCVSADVGGQREMRVLSSNAVKRAMETLRPAADVARVT